MVPVFPPPGESKPETPWDSVEEIQAALAQVRRQKLQLEQRERQLLRTLALASQGRIQEMVGASGGAASTLEGMLRRTLHSSRAGPPEPSGTTAQAGAADRVRKAPLRFRHPDNPGLVWSGRGKTPRWVLELQAKGQLERARIRPEKA